MESSFPAKNGRRIAKRFAPSVREETVQRAPSGDFMSLGLGNQVEDLAQIAAYRHANA